MPASQPLASAEDQSAAFVELFFDSVFVYSVTQVVGLLHHHFDWVGAGQAVLVFWLVWWAWTQFTWTLNAANTAHTHIQFWTLAATAAAFFMAVALPDAFNGGGLGFAIPYVAVRVIGLLLYVWVAWEKPSQRTAVKSFGLLSVGAWRRRSAAESRADLSSTGCGDWRLYWTSWRRGSAARPKVGTFIPNTLRNVTAYS